MNKFTIKTVTENDYQQLATMVGQLLTEIINGDKKVPYQYDVNKGTVQAKSLIEQGKYWAFIAWDQSTNSPAGFIALTEGHALYTQGAYGTITELYVQQQWRSADIGKALIEQAKQFAITRQWQRLEVTTPQLPEFNRSLAFYQNNGFSSSGGAKLKVVIPAQ